VWIAVGTRQITDWLWKWLFNWKHIYTPPQNSSFYTTAKL